MCMEIHFSLYCLWPTIREQNGLKSDSHMQVMTLSLSAMCLSGCLTSPSNFPYSYSREENNNRTCLPDYLVVGENLCMFVLGILQVSVVILKDSFWYSIFDFFFFWTGFWPVTQSTLNLKILLSQSPRYWDYKCKPHLSYSEILAALVTKLSLSKYDNCPYIRRSNVGKA